VSADGRLDPEEVRAGFIYAHDRANMNTQELEELRSTLEALVEMLLDAGLDFERMKELRAKAEEGVRRRYTRAGMGVVRQDFDVPKREWAEVPEIDCASRIHLCHATCCRLRIGLSTEDVKEGVLRWDLSAPYSLAKRPDGWCVHCGKDGSCGVYEARPIPCRAYDCRRDPRIWEDFDAGIVNPAIEDPTWPDCLHRDAP
jgi:hypothetical protein